MNTETLLVLIVVGLILIYLIYKNQNPNQYSENLENVNNNVSNTTKTETNKKVLGVYYTNWCGYSRHFLSDLENGLQRDLEKHVTVKLIDCETDENKQLCNKLGVRGFPTLILHTENDNIMYNGDRSHDDLLEFVQH